MFSRTVKDLWRRGSFCHRVKRSCVVRADISNSRMLGNADQVLSVIRLPKCFTAFA